jgi:DNA-binding XRE family transcriptional regulator
MNLKTPPVTKKITRLVCYRFDSKRKKADVKGEMAKAQHAQRYRRLPGMLREMRESASLTQRDLGKKLRMTHVAVHKSEVGDRRVDVTEFIDWCVACGTSPEGALRKLIAE